MTRSLFARLAVGALPVAAMVSSVSSALAQSRGPSPAEKLFAEGRALDGQGLHDEACAKFEASETLEPAVGTLLNLATCAERAGRTATAWQRYREAAVLAARRADAEREAVANRGAAALENRRFRLLLRPPTSPLPPSTVLSRDGGPVLPSDLGVAVPVDPGAHTLTATAPGYRPWSASVDVGGGARIVVVDLPALEPEVVQGEPRPSVEPSKPTGSPLVEPSSRPPLPPPSTRAEQPLSPAPPAHRGGSSKTWAVVVGGTGAVVLGAGVYFALESRSLWADVTSVCPAGRCPDEKTLDAKAPQQRDAAQDGTIGTVGLAVGGVALAAGVLWYVLAGRHPKEPLVVGGVGGGRRGVLGASLTFD
jgi:serine/threonine-protein kinase